MKSKPTNVFLLFRVVYFLTLTALLTHRAWAGSIERLIYYDSGTAVTNLTTSSSFPNQPSYAEQLDDFNAPLYGFQSKEDAQYDPLSFGSYTRGYLEAPATGSYIFFIASDNASELWLSTNETVSALQRIAFETNSGAPLFSGARLSQRESPTIALVGGQKYYLEVYHQGGTPDTSYVQVGWQRPDGVQEIIPALHLAQYPVDLYSGNSYTAPVLNARGFNNGDLPAQSAANEGINLILQVDAIAAQPTTFQWFRNGTVVPGANLSYLEFTPVRAAASGDTYQVVISNSYGAITSSLTTLAVTPDTTAPTIVSAGAQGNPNGVSVLYSKPVDPASATNISNYSLKVQGGSSLAIASATLLADQQTVRLSGVFNFQLGISYQLTVTGILDQSTTPNILSPNPTVETFAYAAPTGTLYNFNSNSTNGFNLYGAAALVASGSYDGSGDVKLTDASAFEKGVLQFASVGSLDHFHLDFKVRIGDASATPGDGFSINIASDLPQGTFLNEQEGYAPLATPSANRLELAFDNDRLVNGLPSPAIVVKWQGSVVASYPTGVGNIPAINSADGHWADVDLQLKRGGNLSLTFDGALVFTNLATGFVPVEDAQVEIAAQTGANYETHWFDDINLNYAEGDIGPVGFVSNPPLTNLTVLENLSATFTVIPSGASPFYYQWNYNGSALSGETNPVLAVIGNANTVGSYSVTVSNWFSQTNSPAATLTVTPDTTAAHLVSARGLAGGLNQVLLTFNKPLDSESATNLSTYNLGFLALFSASLSADGLTVTLSTGTLERDQLYLFSINGLRDTTAAQNQLTVNASFIADVDYAAQIGLDGSIRYWRFGEPNGNSTVSSITTGADAMSLGVATLENSPALGAPSLIPSEPQDNSVLFTAADDQWILVPNGTDLNITDGPWTKKSFEFWFNANSVPAPGTTGLAAAAGLYEQGAATRDLGFYLWRDPNDPNPDEAQLVFNAFNNASDGAGSPWGASAGSPSPTTPVFAQTTVQAGTTYHVVGVFNGDPVSTNGTLTLYLNGAAVSTVGGAGQIYNHSGDIEIGQGNTLIHTGVSGQLANFDGVLDDLSLYNAALSASVVANHYQAGTNATASSGPPAVARVDTLGNPNQILLTFTKAIAPATAANLANYALQNTSGGLLAITNATLLGGDRTIQLLGNFGFQVNSNYTLNVVGITDQSIPANLIAPNPTNVAVTFAAPVGITYDFNSGLPSGAQIYGATYVTNSGSYDGSGFIDLTDAATNENGALLFNERHDISQARIRFKTRLSNGSSPAGAGFSVNIATDLPEGVFSTPEKGYLPAATINASRLVVSFDNLGQPSISIVWQGNILTNVLAGANGVPPLNNADGHWAAVDINLQATGLINVSYDGVIVITNLATGFQPLLGAQVGFGARTTTAYESHWFDDINLNFADGSIGPVTIPVGGQPLSSTNLENQEVALAVSPSGVEPFGYQWYENNLPIAGATNRVFYFSATTSSAGAYYVKVWNDFSSATSSAATVSVQTDLTAATVTNVTAYGGSLNEVILSFDKLLDPASATNISTYAFAEGGLSISNIVLGANGNTVTIFTSQQQNLQTNVLAISGLFNLAAFPHALATNLTFQSGVSYSGEVLADNPVRYVRFDETNGTVANSDVSVVDTFATAEGTYNNSPVLGVPPLVSNSTGSAVLLKAANSNSVSFVASEKDISNLTLTNRTIEFWFKASTLPYATGTTNHAPPLWIEGAGSRYLEVYLYGTNTATINPNSALLVFSGGNLVTKDGPGSPWGATNGVPQNAVYTSVPVTSNQLYHVVAVLQGNSVAANGQLLLYTNGVLAATTGGAGYLYGHTGAAPRVGVGSSAFRHDGIAFATSDFFDGVFDDLSLYNTALSPSRIAIHDQVGFTPPLNGNAAVIPLPKIGIVTVANGRLTINWTGTALLQRANSPNGPFATVVGAASPYQESTANGPAFFRLVQ